MSSTALDDARVKVEQLGGTIGEQLVIGGAIEDDDLTDFYQSRLLVPKVNPNSLARLPIKVVAAIPSDMAIELRAIPVSLDADNNLTVAMSDPSDRHAVDEIAFFTGAYVVRACATQMQIAWCLAHYYGHLTALGNQLIQGGNDPKPEPAPAPVERLPRQKGLTGRVDATRHRGIPPVTGPINAVRPNSGELDLPPPDGAERVTEPEATDGTPQPRARSISGEIRVARGPRAQSIKPVVEEEEIYGEDDQPVITMEADDPDPTASSSTSEDPTGPLKLVARRRKAKTDPPELAARAGELDNATGPIRIVDEAPRIIIDDSLAPSPVQPEASGELRIKTKRNDTAAPVATIEVDDDSMGVVIHEHPPRADSEPVLLDRRRPSDPPLLDTPPPAQPQDKRAPIGPTLPEDDDIVVLEPRTKKPSGPARTIPRPKTNTQIGVGALPAITRIHRDTDAGGVPDDEIDDGPTTMTGDVGDATRVDARAAPPSGDDTTDENLVAPPSPDDTGSHPIAPPHPSRAESPSTRPTPNPRANSEGDDGRHTAVMSAVELDNMIPDRTSGPDLGTNRVDYDPVDDSWGPPGTTIPPPLLGAVPGSDDEDGGEIVKGIPLSMDSAPLIVAPPSPPEISRAVPQSSGTILVRALEEATSRSIELINALEHAKDRNAIIELMIDHLAESHRRSGFFAVKPLPNPIAGTRAVNELVLFAMEPRPASPPVASLRLDRSSTLQDVVGTRLPYRGPMHDDASRTFLTSILGGCPPEILLVPVAIRERVVGVLFGEHRVVHTFDDQLALAARAAGMALERVLKTKRH
ncbi:MAG: hypothetical protein M4D80_03990 [Myxococcota bacterium]|nr:hypothetical protein [Myxococcota bacterium]